MVSIEKIQEYFRGKEGWRTLNRVIGWGSYTTFLLCMFIIPFLIGWLILGFVIILPAYGYLYEHHMREIEKNKGGGEGFGGWVEHEHGKGEKKKFEIADVQPIERLSKKDRDAVDNYINYVMTKTQEIVEMGIEVKKPQLQLSYKELKEKEQEELEEYEKKYLEWKKKKEEEENNGSKDNQKTDG